MTEATTEYRPRWQTVPTSTVSFNICEATHAKFHSMAQGMGISDSEFIRRAIKAYVQGNTGYVPMKPDSTRVDKGTIWNEYQPTPEELERSLRFNRWSNKKAGQRVRAYFDLMDKCPDLTGLDKPQRKTKRATISKKVEAVIEPVEKPKPIVDPKPVEIPVPYVKPAIPIMPMNAECAKYPDEAVLEQGRHEGKAVMRWSLKPAVYLSQRWLDRLQPYPEVDTPRARKMLALMEGISTLDYTVIEERAALCERLGEEWGITPIEEQLSLAIYTNMMVYVNELYIPRVE